MWYVYILKCENDAYYTGITTNIDRRLCEHTGFQSGKYTTYNKPNRLVYSEKYKNRLEAESRERQIKKWSRSKKQALINGKLDQLRELSKSRN